MGGPGVHVKPGLAAQPQRHVGANGSAHGALALVGFRVAAVAPVVVAVHVAAVQVHPRLLFVYDIFSLHAGEGQGVEAHGALGPGCVDLLPQSLQVLDGRRAREPLGRAPQQRRPAQVDQGAVLQDVGLVFYLVAGHKERLFSLRAFTDNQVSSAVSSSFSALPSLDAT